MKKVRKDSKRPLSLMHHYLPEIVMPLRWYLSNDPDDSYEPKDELDNAVDESISISSSNYSEGEKIWNRYLLLSKDQLTSKISELEGELSNVSNEVGRLYGEVIALRKSEVSGPIDKRNRLQIVIKYDSQCADEGLLRSLLSIAKAIQLYGVRLDAPPSWRKALEWARWKILEPRVYSLSEYYVIAAALLKKDEKASTSKGDFYQRVASFRKGVTNGAETDYHLKKVLLKDGESVWRGPKHVGGAHTRDKNDIVQASIRATIDRAVLWCKENEVVDPQKILRTQPD